MLLRIAPEMLLDERFTCVTHPDVRDEFFKTQKFKEKYPWRKAYRNKVQCFSATKLNDPTYKQSLQAVKCVAEGINDATGRKFGLSRVDKEIAAAAIAFDYQLSTGDTDLFQFLDQEFAKSNVSPLEIVNDWLAKDLIEWDEQKQNVLEDWRRCEERAQPPDQIAIFEQLTDYKYPAH